MMQCPVCLSTETDDVIRVHSISAAAEHFIPAARSRDRNEKLTTLLRRLWNGAESVEIHRCRVCGFGFPIPYIAGDMEFYNLIYGGDPHYPRNRWEFRQTIRTLERQPFSSTATLLEAGAGEGWFLEALRRSKGGHRFRAFALEYDRAAIAKLIGRGFSARPGSITDLSRSERFDVICLFHTLEHMDDVAGAFRALHDALKPRGHAFMSVPHGPSVDQQEDALGFWDMPPNHVGRWTRQAFEIAAHRHGLNLLDFAVEPANRVADLSRLSVYSVQSRAYGADSWAHRVNAVGHRPLRVLLKATMAAALMPILAWRVRPILGHSLWVHLQRR